MSGHSKWSTIKRQKQSNDARRGQEFTKLANAISMAVREGGGVADPADNFKLRLVVEKARNANMPKNNIDRAIARGAGKGKDGVEFSEALYEGFGPGGSAILATVVTDNKNRAQTRIRMVFDKGGGRLGGAGSAAHLFDHVGSITIPRSGYSFDEILQHGLDAGALDVVEQEGSYVVYTQPQQVHAIKGYFDTKGVVIAQTELFYQPKEHIILAPDVQQSILKLLENLESIDDVQEVFTNSTFDAI